MPENSKSCINPISFQWGSVLTGGAITAGFLLSMCESDSSLLTKPDAGRTGHYVDKVIPWSCASYSSDLVTRQHGTGTLTRFLLDVMRLKWCEVEAIVAWNTHACSPLHCAHTGKIAHKYKCGESESIAGRASQLRTLAHDVHSVRRFVSGSVASLQHRAW